MTPEQIIKQVEKELRADDSTRCAFVDGFHICPECGEDRMHFHFYDNIGITYLFCPMGCIDFEKDINEPVIKPKLLLNKKPKLQIRKKPKMNQTELF